MKTLLTRAALSCVILASVAIGSGCVSKQTYRNAAESGWKRWTQDHKKVIPNEDYKALPPEERKHYMPESLYDARMFEQKQALGLLED